MPSTETDRVLHLPDEINYECTGCGKCCGGWSVPMTQDDYERISAVNWGEYDDRYKMGDLFRDLKPYESAGTPYGYAIKEGGDGHCPFLKDNLCFIHSKHGSTFKPSICQLFPYCFNETPSGIYATVSFVSMGVVNNSGKPLTEQRDYLETKLKEFKTLFPDHHPNWSNLKLAVDKPLAWDEYLEIEKEMLKIWAERDKPLDDRFLAISDMLVSRFKGAAVTPPANAGSMKSLDKNLLVALYKIYFPVKKLGRGEGDFNAGRFAYQTLFEGVFPGLRLKSPTRSYSFEELAKMEFPQDKDVEDLIYRYFRSRIFAKLYFGAGFGQLSLITGFHHLLLTYVLLKENSKIVALSRGAGTVSYVDVVVAVRTLEKRLGETALGGYAAAILELLLFSPGRMRRILANT
ncbi:MAG: YkgJ family cysteine cluster protein [Candidatus Melainabacteria bacterium]|jgi:Fe-S-cluster containining protein|nr:YkgJ family cysteine cluster protein [Candidatus Melainabacteria bacterium]